MDKLEDFLDSEDLVDKKKFKKFLDQNTRYKSLYEEYENITDEHTDKQEMMKRFLSRYINDQSRYDYIASLTEDPVPYDDFDNHSDLDFLSEESDEEPAVVVKIDECYLREKFVELINTTEIGDNETYAISPKIRIGHSRTSFFYQISTTVPHPSEKNAYIINRVFGEIPTSSFSYRLQPEEVRIELREQIQFILSIDRLLAKKIMLLKHSMESI